MGLRDFLLGAQQFSEGTKGMRETLDLEKKREAQEALRAQYPSIIENLRSGAGMENQGLSDLLQNANAAGDDNNLLVKYTLENMIGSKNKKARTVEAMKAINPNLTPEDLQAAEAMTFAEQSDLLKARLDPKTAALEQGRQNRFTTGQKRLTEVDAQKQATKTFDVLNKTKDAFRAEDYQLQSIRDTMKRGGQLADNIVANYVIRGVGAEKGPLSDSDRAAIMGIVPIANTWEEFKSRFTQKEYDKLSDSTRRQLADVVKISAEKFESRKANAMTQDVRDLYLANPKLRDENGQPLGQLKAEVDDLKKMGLNITFSKDGQVTVAGKKKSLSLNSNASSLMNKIKDIPDQNIKKQVGLAIQAVGGNLTDAQLDAINKKYNLQGGQ